MELFKYIFGSLMRPWFLFYAMTPLLSQYKAIGSIMLGAIPSLMMNFLIQPTSFVFSDIEVCLTLVVKSILVSYLELFQLIGLLFRVKYN
jgi:hypothetical protein